MSSIMFNVLPLDDDRDNTLVHFGKKGMRWGVITGTKKSGTPSQKQKIKDMSTAELQAHVNRMNLERSYAKMMKQDAMANRSPIQRGAATAGTILAASGKTAVQNYVAKSMSTALEKSITSLVK